MNSEIIEDTKLISETDVFEQNTMNNYFYKYSSIIIIIIVLIISFSSEKNKSNESYPNISEKNNSNENYNNIKVCLCAIGKKENLYAEEFIDYYIKLGYDKIFIYDNNDKDDERFEDVLQKQIANNFVKIIDYRGYRGKRNKPQYDSYLDCYKRNSQYCDWLSFFDFDEFLYLKYHKNIKQFLSDKKFETCDNIKINWIVYSDNNLVYYDDRKIQERFTEKLLNDADNMHIKSTVRGHMKINYWSEMNNPHVSRIKVNACLANGQKVLHEYDSPFHTPPNYDAAYIKHYATKTIEEFITKIKRGYSDRKYKVDNKFIQQRLNYFFAKNKKTKKKLEIIQQLLNYTNDDIIY